MATSNEAEKARHALRRRRRLRQVLGAVVCVSWSSLGWQASFPAACA